MDIVQLEDEANFEVGRLLSLAIIKKTNLESKYKLKLKEEEFLLEKEKKLSMKIMKKVKSNAKQRAEHKANYKTKVKEKCKELLNIEKISNLVSGRNIEAKSKEKIKLKLEKKPDLKLEEKEKLIKENKPKLNKKDKDNQEIEEKTPIETDKKIKLAKGKQSRLEMEEKAPFENVGISFNLNQKLISSINGKGSIKNNGEEPLTKNRNNYINKKD